MRSFSPGAVATIALWERRGDEGERRREKERESVCPLP